MSSIVTSADNLQLGAIDIETNQYFLPTEAIKGKSYKCLDCSKPVILRKGTIRKPHFAHYAQTNVCSYYDHPNESQIHKDAKMLMAKLLTEKKRIQFVWKCDYAPCYETLSINSAFQEVPTIEYKEGDDVKIEYRDTENKWVADVAIVNNGVVRYIIEIKNTHATTTARPEPWFEVNAIDLIQDINELNAEHPSEPEIDEYKTQEDYIYLIGCERTDIIRYCYGSFCYKEHWVDKIPGYNKKLTMVPNNCILCNTKDYEPTTDGCTMVFQRGEIRVCINCLKEDTYKKRIRTLYAPPCYGMCFKQTNDGGYNQRKCPDKCKLMACPKCNSGSKYPEHILMCHGGRCSWCNIDKCVKTFINVPYARKEEAKALGAKWDNTIRKWYIFNDEKNKSVVLSKFSLIV